MDDDEAGYEQAWMAYVDAHNRKENGFGYYFFGDIGYRHVANSGFLFRCDLNPCFNFGGKHAVCRTFGDTFRKFSLGLYLGFGWSF